MDGPFLFFMKLWSYVMDFLVDIAIDIFIGILMDISTKIRLWS